MLDFMKFNPNIPYDVLGKLPPDINYNDTELLKLIGQARTELGELKGYSLSLPNPLLLLSPAILKESLASSEIEGIRTTIIQVMENQLFSDEERRDPDKEVLRYREAVMWGFKQIDKYNLSTRLVLGIQDRLMTDMPKGYRQQQNAIEDKKTKTILYTPPTQNNISQHMGNLENFLNNPPKDMDALIACAMGHYQFEAIHPFGDGNGRTGRILMVLQLVNAGILNLPILYISGYINDNKSEYYEKLLAVTTKGWWEDYLKFMLQGYKIQAKATKDIIFKIMSLFWELKDKIKKEDKVIYSADLIEALFTFPVISPTKLANELNIHYTTASRYLNRLKELGILRDKQIGKYHLYVNLKLIEFIHKG